MANGDLATNTPNWKRLTTKDTKQRKTISSESIAISSKVCGIVSVNRIPNHSILFIL